MPFIEIRKVENSDKKRKRVGRGTGNGTGKTCGKGHKGQKSRKGIKTFVGFEGGQMPLYRRIPKRGFKSLNKKEYNIVNLSLINERFKDGEKVNLESLMEKGLIKKAENQIKVLGNGDLTLKKLEFDVNIVSKSARKKIEDNEGKILEKKAEEA